jgi:putative endonuclease
MLHTDVSKFHAGKDAYHGGAAAELSVERVYTDLGFRPLARRWRGTAGEIDLILALGEGFVFVEVKKSRSFAAAAARVSVSQTRRILAAATEFVATAPRGQLSAMRFDVALCDSAGEVRILENALYCD